MNDSSCYYLDYMVLTRRRLLVTLPTVLLAGRAGLGARQTGLEQFATAGPPCEIDPRATPAVAPDGTFLDGAPERSVLAGSGVTGTPLVLTGTVAGLACGRIGGARVDLWQADGRGVLDAQGVTLRGWQRTSADGSFRFESVVPGARAGQAPHLSLRVRVDTRADLQTAFFFPDDPRNAGDPRYRPELLLRVTGDRTGRRASVDILLDL